MELELLGVIIASCSLAILVFQYIKLRKAITEVPILLQEALNTVAPSITEALQPISELSSKAMSIIGSQGGIAKGINYQLKGAEQEVLAEGINQVTGLPVGDIAAKYLQKYPALRMLLPLLLQGKSLNPGAGGGSSGSGEFGDQRLVKR